MHRTGILFSNLGTPEAPTPRALRSFLREFLSDPFVVDLPRLPWWLLLNLIIVPFRSPNSARLYEKIWTDQGSPLKIITERQVDLLRSRTPDDTPIVIGMRYGQPSIERAVATLIDEDCSDILLLPMYPQFSRTTTQTTFNEVQRQLVDHPRVRLRAITQFCADPAYISALAASILSARHGVGPAQHLVMSFHGIPVRYAENGDPYPQHCETTAKLLARKLDLNADQWTLAYQSRFGKEPWLEPATDVLLAELGKKGCQSVEILCPGFPADCLETLEEIAIGGRQIFTQAGGGEYRFIPCLNDDQAFITALASMINRRLG